MIFILCRGMFLTFTHFFPPGTSLFVWTTSSTGRQWPITSGRWCRGRSRCSSWLATTASSPSPSTWQVGPLRMPCPLPPPGCRLALWPLHAYCRATLADTIRTSRRVDKLLQSGGASNRRKEKEQRGGAGLLEVWSVNSGVWKKLLEMQ